MKTVVFQSFRTCDVPDVIPRCLDTVRSWAKTRDYEYRFIDDALFDRVPDWFRVKVNDNRLPMSDLGRLIVAQELLNAGFDRTIWFDADVLIFAPDAFDVTNETDYAFGHEIWVRRGDGKSFFVTEGLHNAICIFSRGNSFLDFYIEAAETIVREAEGKVLSHQIGPDFLNRHADKIGARVMHAVSLFSPLVIADIANVGGQALEAHLAAAKGPIHATNLCQSFVGRLSSGVVVTEQMLDAAVGKLLAARRPLTGPEGLAQYSAP